MSNPKIHKLKIEYLKAACAELERADELAQQMWLRVESEEPFNREQTKELWRLSQSAAGSSLQLDRLEAGCPPPKDGESEH